MASLEIMSNNPSILLGPAPNQPGGLTVDQSQHDITKHAEKATDVIATDSGLRTTTQLPGLDDAANDEALEPGGDASTVSTSWSLALLILEQEIRMAMRSQSAKLPSTLQRQINILRGLGAGRSRSKVSWYYRRASITVSMGILMLSE